MHAVRTALWVMALVIVLGACRSKGAETSVGPDPDTPVVVEVENHYQGDVVVYLVTALSRATFSFPWRRLQESGSNRLLAYPIAGARAYASEPLYVQPGQSITWTLESDLERSNLAVY